MKISVVTACFNSSDYVGSALSSVDSQRDVEVEHIIVDGGSADPTMDIIARHSAPWRLAVSEPDRGIYDAMNKGIARATGDVIGFINSDDFLAGPDVLSTVAKAFEDPDVDAVYGDLAYVAQNDVKKLKRIWRSSQFVPGLFARGWCPPHPTFYVRRRVYEKLGGFDLRYRIAADVELMMRFLEKHKIRSIYLPKMMVKMRVGGLTNSNSATIYRQNAEILAAARDLGVPISPARFFLLKVVDRLGQRLRAAKGGIA